MKQVSCQDCKKLIEVPIKCNVQTRCFVCKTIHNRKRDKRNRLNNPKRLEYERQWKRNWFNNLSNEEKLAFYNQRKQNPEYKIQKSNWDKKYRKTHRKELNKKFIQKMKEDPLFKVTNTIRTMINLFLKSKENKDISEIYSIIGIDTKGFKKYLESKFKEGMTWENKGEWHIDHIKPLALAKTKPEVYSLCHYTNLQPLWAEENLIKGKNA